MNEWGERGSLGFGWMAHCYCGHLSEEVFRGTIFEAVFSVVRIISSILVGYASFMEES